MCSKIKRRMLPYRKYCSSHVTDIIANPTTKPAPFPFTLRPPWLTWLWLLDGRCTGNTYGSQNNAWINPLYALKVRKPQRNSRAAHNNLGAIWGPVPELPVRAPAGPAPGNELEAGGNMRAGAERPRSNMAKKMKLSRVPFTGGNIARLKRLSCRPWVCTVRAYGICRERHKVLQ